MRTHELRMYEECFKLAVTLSKQAGKIVLQNFYNSKNIEQKEGAADGGFVTDTDFWVENFIKTHIKQKFPSHRFVGEESTCGSPLRDLTDEPTWFVDPIDGTTNFIHRFPYLCISIGFVVNKKSEFGVVFNPIMDNLYTGKRGEGAFMNGTRINVSQVSDIKDSMILNEVGVQLSLRPDVFYDKIENFTRVAAATKGIRCVGSAVMSICLVAQGSAEGYFEFGLHSWDMAAASVILEEAGGTIVGARGEIFDVMARHVVCACSHNVADSLVKMLKFIEFEKD